ncbi:hypothetical protein [uncultured Cohaesibacter sp.]|uniref:hypothetical protein n=1 Tax=uncultured Cohaesibacter sp. TaxID=1002546 RepID=UPI00292DD69C|nr:hypothetical protein [uncultured Cohaesibacter sp.]
MLTQVSNPYGVQTRHAPVVALKEGDCPLAFTRDDFIRYAGPDQIIASALMFQMLTCAIAALSPDEPMERNDLKLQVGFPGPGVTDIIELVLRGSTRNAHNITIKTEGLPMEAPEALIGRFYFEFEYRGKRIALWPVDGYFTDEFRAQVKQFQPRKGDDATQEAYQTFKHGMVAKLMAADPTALFHRKIVA